MLERIRTRLQQIPQENRFTDLPEAGVLIPLTDRKIPELVLTRRAPHLSSHAGEVAFPGGKMDPEDSDIVATALRESHEEIGLPPSAVDVVGSLPPARSRFGLKVTPIVGIISPHQPLVANEDELDHIFSVPLQYFLDHQPNDSHEVEYQGQRFQFPCYNYQGNIIWGLTAYFIAEFMNHIFDTEITIQLRTTQR